MRKLVIIIIALILCSCGTRKRTVDKLKSETAISQETSSSQTASVTSQRDTQQAATVVASERGAAVVFTGKVADSTKSATITEEIKDGKKVTTFVNFKDIKKETISKDTQSTATTTAAQQEAQASNSKTNAESKLQGSSKNQSKLTQLQSKKGFPWWILILFLLVGYFVTSYFKGLDFRKWLS